MFYLSHVYLDKYTIYICNELEKNEVFIFFLLSSRTHYATFHWLQVPHDHYRNSLRHCNQSLYRLHSSKLLSRQQYPMDQGTLLYGFKAPGCHIAQFSSRSSL